MILHFCIHIKKNPLFNAYLKKIKNTTTYKDLRKDLKKCTETSYKKSKAYF